MPRFQKTGLITKMVVFALLSYMTITMLNVQSQIQALRQEEAELYELVEAQSQQNANLAAAVDNPHDPDRIADVARDKLGLITPGGKVFYITH